MFEVTEPFISVQPENRTLIEESLEYAWHTLLANQRDPFPELKQPRLTSEHFVSLLAGERGVTDWRPEDSLEQQRKTADNAFEIHRKAGTRHGLAVAMDALDCDIEVTPWYQMDAPPGPYHIEVVAWKRNEPVNQKAAKRMLTRIENTKSERDTVDLILAFGLDTGLAFSGAYFYTIVGDESYQGTMPNDAWCAGGSYFAGGMRMVMSTDITLGART
ncbi:phage tail protein I [Photobacterium angustum]|uniref:phage tail protein I n=1 Tax=Photobacterium angustum TaxID=661 RepID=UPI0005E60489|nr:phage tail protein I [Photobacterium angustum]KJF95191.1 tail protein [Photobacterium angustum]PSW81115.1 phage tail protein I [Photobacterium angustum]